MKHLTMEELEAGVDEIRRAPKSEGVLQLIVRRPKVEEREILEEAQLDTAEGLVGDTWRMRKSTRTADGSPHPDMQLNIMNARVASLLAVEKNRWPLAGDQLYIDLDLSTANLPAGTQLARRDRRHRGDGSAAHRVQQVRLAVRRGRDEVRQLAARPASCACAASTRKSCARGTIRRGRRGQEDRLTCIT